MHGYYKWPINSPRTRAGGMQIAILGADGQPLPPTDQQLAAHSATGEWHGVACLSLSLAIPVSF
eukprot:COSAG05_NODE_399_length_10267_cov_21.327301_1_plen_64_part_00